LLWIEWQYSLKSLDQIKEQHRNATEQQHRCGVFSPLHLSLFVDSSQSVDQPLNRPQQSIEKSLLAVEDVGHEDAEWLRKQNDDCEENQDLKPTVQGHDQNFSGRSNAYTR